jgi:hypothetical protein
MWWINMLNALEANKGIDNKIDANELANALKTLKPGEVARGLTNKMGQIEKIDGLKDAVQQLIDQHAAPNSDLNLSPTAINALYTLHKSLTGWFWNDKIKKSDVNVDKYDTTEIRSQVWEQKIEPLLIDSGITTGDNFWEKEYKVDWTSSNVIGNVAIQHSGDTYFLPFKFDGTFENSETGLEVKNQSLDKSLYARLTMDDGKLVLEDEDTNKEWNNFLDLAKNFPSLDGVETRIGERTISVLDTNDNGFIDKQLSNDTAFLDQNKVDNMDFNVLKQKHTDQKNLLSTYESTYEDIKGDITGTVASMQRESYPYTKNMKDASFNNFKTVVAKSLLQLLDTWNVEPKPAWWDESFANVVPEGSRGLGNKKWELQSEVSKLWKNIDDLRTRFVSENKDALFAAAPKITIDNTGKLASPTVEGKEITVWGSKETVTDYVSLYDDNLLVTLNDNQWTTFKKQPGKDGDPSYATTSSKWIDVTNPVVNKPTEAVTENPELTQRIDALGDGFMFEGTGAIKNKEAVLATEKAALTKLAWDETKKDALTTILSGFETASKGPNKSNDQRTAIRSVQSIINPTDQNPDGFRWPRSHAKLLEFAGVTQPTATETAPLVSTEWSGAPKVEKNTPSWVVSGNGNVTKSEVITDSKKPEIVPKDINLSPMTDLTELKNTFWISPSWWIYYTRENEPWIYYTLDNKIRYINPTLPYEQVLVSKKWETEQWNKEYPKQPEFITSHLQKSLKTALTTSGTPTEWKNIEFDSTKGKCKLVSYGKTTYINEETLTKWRIVPWVDKQSLGHNLQLIDITNFIKKEYDSTKLTPSSQFVVDNSYGIRLNNVRSYLGTSVNTTVLKKDNFEQKYPFFTGDGGTAKMQAYVDYLNKIYNLQAT